MPQVRCAFIGVARDAEVKTSKAGKDYLSITVDCDGDDEPLTVASFQGVERLCGLIKPGSHLFIKGTIKLHRWGGDDGRAKARQYVTASEIEVLFLKQGRMFSDYAEPDAATKAALDHPSVKMVKAVFPDAKITSVTNTKTGEKWIPGPAGTHLNDTLEDAFSA